jgi:hypothetical protein
MRTAALPPTAERLLLVEPLHSGSQPHAAALHHRPISGLVSAQAKALRQRVDRSEDPLENFRKQEQDARIRSR